MTYPGKKKRGLRAWEAGFSNSRYEGPSLGRCTCPSVRWPADVGCSMNGRKAVCRPGVLHFRPSKNKLQLIDVTVPSHNVVFTNARLPRRSICVTRVLHDFQYTQVFTTAAGVVAILLGRLSVGSAFHYRRTSTNLRYLFIYVVRPQRQHGTPPLKHQRTRSFVLFRTCKNSTPLLREVPSGKWRPTSRINRLLQKRAHSDKN